MLAPTVLFMAGTTTATAGELCHLDDVDWILCQPALEHIFVTKPRFKDKTFGLDERAERFASRACSDPRDKLYGVLGMVHKDDSSSITVDYERPITRVFKDAVMVIMSSQYSRRDKYGFVVRNGCHVLGTCMGLDPDAVDLMTTHYVRPRSSRFKLTLLMSVSSEKCTHISSGATHDFHWPQDGSCADIVFLNIVLGEIMRRSSLCL